MTDTIFLEQHSITMYSQNPENVWNTEFSGMFWHFFQMWIIWFEIIFLAIWWSWLLNLKFKLGLNKLTVTTTSWIKFKNWCCCWSLQQIFSSFSSLMSQTTNLFVFFSFSDVYVSLNSDLSKFKVTCDESDPELMSLARFNAKTKALPWKEQ